MIKVKQLNKEVKIGANFQHILTDVSLEIKAGEFISILGPSGAGKSTLLYCLSGLETISSGEVYLNKQALHQLKPEAQAKFRFDNIGFIFQDFHLIPMLSVKENIIFTSQMYRYREDQAYLSELLTLVELADKADVLVAHLSGGQQQRVAIARGLYMKPKILFADEPTGNLDSKTAAVIAALLKKVNQELKTTIVQVTHDEKLAKGSSRIIRMKDGRIIKKSLSKSQSKKS